MYVLFTNHIGIPSVIACVFFSQTTYGSTRVHCMYVLFIDHIWIHQSSLHVCSFHKPPMDPLVSLHVCYFHRPHMDPLEFIASLFFSHTTYESTRVLCMCFTNHS